MFDIFMDNKIVGTAKAERKGLYYHFTCTCKPPDNGIYRVWVSDGSAEIDLGICVPEGAFYTLRKQLPAKLLRDAEFKFTLLPKDRKLTYAPKEKNLSFQDLELLQYAKLSDESEEQTIIIEQAPDQPDSDPNP